MALIENNMLVRREIAGYSGRKDAFREAAAIMNLIRSTMLLTAVACLFAIPVGIQPAYGQDPDMTVVSPQALPPYRLRYNVADEWEIHRRAASPNYRAANRSIFVDPGYTCYCPLQPRWNGVFSAGGQPHPRACCR
jgi:hypothetical protein